MARLGLGSGATHIFDDVDKSDFKSDPASEFPVGPTFDSPSQLTLPTPACRPLVLACLPYWNDSHLCCPCHRDLWLSRYPHCGVVLPPL
jgi:hypothetical protein